ncbi:MAG: ribose-phosphate pyrophosphokinase [Saprospiraceae bacterium]|nr:ribose-phosphate pyrophosphokinase [Saprospiraceae bacterium]
MAQDVKLFSGTNSRYLAEKIALEYGQELGNIEIQRFKDGEFQPVIKESVRGAYVFFIQSTFAPSDNLMELLLMIDAAKRASAGYITAVIPYYGMARQDRKDKPRVAIGAKLVADLLTAAGANRIVTMELHAAQIQGFFDIPFDHLESTPIFYEYLKSLDQERLIIASPDIGGTKRARNYAQYLDIDFVMADKHRKKANEVAEMHVIGDVKDMDVVLVDDMIDTGGTLCKAAEVMMQQGARSVRAVCTHPIFSGNAIERLENSSLKEVVVCDTLPLETKSEKIKVLSVASLFATAIRNTHEHKSINSLFIRYMKKFEV